MFLQFFIWGSWYVTMGTYLNEIGFNGSAIGEAYSTMALAAIISPLFVGMIADKFFGAEKVLGFMHLLGGIFIYWTSLQTDPASLYWILLLHALCYMPTLALVNAVAFYQMKNPEKEFPIIRVLGTTGWIFAGLLIGFMKIEPTKVPFLIASVASVLLGLFAFTLPYTPPKSKGQKTSIIELLGLNSFKLMKDPSFAILIVSSFLISIPLSFYFSFANLYFNESGMEYAASKMILGQASEVLFLLLMPFFFKRLGVKKMMLVGMMAWVIRYLLFAYGNNEELVFLFYAGIIIHGICYDFFFVTGQIYVDKKAPESIRSNAQGFITLVTYGVGMFVGTLLAGKVAQAYETKIASGEIVGHEWFTIWLIPAALAFVVCILFVLFFNDEKEIKPLSV